MTSTRCGIIGQTRHLWDLISLSSSPPLNRTYSNASDESEFVTQPLPSSFHGGVNDIIRGLRLITPDSRKWDFRNIEPRSWSANFNFPRLFPHLSFLFIDYFSVCDPSQNDFSASPFFEYYIIYFRKLFRIKRKIEKNHANRKSW